VEKFFAGSTEELQVQVHKDYENGIL